jgi:phosphate transport system permease protein
MVIPAILSVIALLSAAGYYLGKKTSLRKAGGRARDLRSLPSHYGMYVALWCALPAIIVLAIWISFQPVIIRSMIIPDLPDEISSLPEERLSLVINDIINVASGAVSTISAEPAIRDAAAHYSHLRNITYFAAFLLALSAGIAGLWYAWRKISTTLNARTRVETIIRVIMMLCSTLAILTTIGIVLSVLFEAIRFFRQIPPVEFLTGLKWSPQTAIRADQVGASGAFGMIPLLTGTLMISSIAMIIAVPVGMMSAIYMSEYASKSARAVAKPLLEILAGIPTVVYGFFAALVVAPFIRDIGTSIGLDVSSESALAAGLVMGIMVIPFVSSLSDDVINAVPQSLRDASLAMGATPSETMIKIVLPAALPGIVGSVLLAVSRAVGETMIVVMAAGLTANLTANPLEAVTTFTVQIVTLLVGDQEFDSAKTLAAFALGLVLFIMTLMLNIVALYVVRRYREQYE